MAPRILSDTSANVPRRNTKTATAVSLWKGGQRRLTARCHLDLCLLLNWAHERRSYRRRPRIRIPTNNTQYWIANEIVTDDARALDYISRAASCTSPYCVKTSRDGVHRTWLYHAVSIMGTSGTAVYIHLGRHRVPRATHHHATDDVV